MGSSKMTILQTQRWGCLITLADHNEAIELELPRAWEPWTVRNLQKIIKYQAPKIFFPHGNKVGQERLQETL